MTEAEKIKDLLAEKRHSEIVGLLTEIRDLLKVIAPPIPTEEKKENEN